mgnify:CR=1 FL=1|tara:strand:- start:13251 stop:13718 length:468 start_codon:yes stop_codon:yes gene_type:complete
MTHLARTCLAAFVLLSITSCDHGSAPKDKATAVSAAEASDLLINRNWMDLWPESETEKLNVFRFVPSMGGGVFQDRTLFKGTFELFTFNVKGDVIAFNLHHSKEKVEAKFRIERVLGPKPFDLRLTIDSSPRGPSQYFGRSSETATDLGLHPLTK